MEVKIETERGLEVFYGVTDFELLPETTEADIRLFAPVDGKDRTLEVSGDLQQVIDSARVPHDEVPDDRDGDVIHDWRTEEYQESLGAGVYA